MSDRYAIPLSALAGVLGLVSLAGVSMSGQTPGSTAKSTSAKATGTVKAGSPPRTPWGDPDLQGTWFVLADVPKAAVIPHLRRREPPPPVVDEMIRLTYRAIVQGRHATNRRNRARKRRRTI